MPDAKLETRDSTICPARGKRRCGNCDLYYAILCWPNGVTSDDSSGTREVYDDQVCDLHERGAE